MRPRAILTLLGTAFALLAMPKFAFATPNGSDSGCSGKTGIPNDVCTSCGNCHAGGPVPSVALAGSATLNSGATATYTLTVSTSLPQTGADVAVTNGVTLTPVTGNLANSFGELTQPSPQPTVGGTTTYQFSIVGPQYGGTIELWASGMASNNNGGIGGDGATDTTMMITVVGPPNPGTGGAVGTYDAGPTTGPGPTGGFLPDGSAVDVDPPGVDIPDGSANGLAPDDVLHQQSGSCNVALAGSRNESMSGSGLLAAVVVMGGLFLSRKSSRKPSRKL